MEQVQKDETGYCVVCGRYSLFRFDSTIITPQLKESGVFRIVLPRPSIGKKACSVVAVGAI